MNESGMWRTVWNYDERFEDFCGFLWFSVWHYTVPANRLFSRRNHRNHRNILDVVSEFQLCRISCFRQATIGRWAIQHHWVWASVMRKKGKNSVVGLQIMSGRKMFKFKWLFDKKQLSIMRQNDDIGLMRPEEGNQKLARGNALGYVGNTQTPCFLWFSANKFS